MLTGFQNITKVPELKKRILVTCALLIVYRIGVYIPTPGIDNQALSSIFASQSGTLFGLIDNVQVVVPEPGAATLALLGGLVLWMRRKK